jgi:hypothetical protein
MIDKKYIIRDYCAIRNHKVVQHGALVFEGVAGQPAAFFMELYKHFGLNYPKFHKMDNLCKLGFLVSELLLQDKKIIQRYTGEETGIILFNAASSIDTDRNHQLSIHDRSAYFPSPSVFVYTLANIVIGEICIRHKFIGENIFFIDEKFDARRLYSYTKQLFDEGLLKCCLVGWLELNGDNYDGIMYLVEKSTPDTDGIAIFEPERLTEIYLQRTYLWNN